MINIVIPIAGAGSKFAKAGYRVPKPFIDIKGETMIERVLDGLHMDNARFILIARTEHLESNKDVIKRIQEKHSATFLTVNELTDGAACTVLLAKDLIDNDTSLFLADCDHIPELSMYDFIKDVQERKLDGSIMTFTDSDPKWSFTKIDEERHVVEVREKEPISGHANVGFYFWTRGSDFVKAAENMIQKNDRVSSEFYVAPAYNYGISDGLRFGIYEVDISQINEVGTPEDLKKFLVKLS
jgi:UDP-N-acetylglucosamine diphosphorylase / glucose-1-phosphate thymidylyltransferase / UDP-N-acetylgalactosamine diphosphorylase / glucosamine-1-phosphate N-acetyltransferase / galactosamine-1-phosphate N-acetyltransferase